LWQREHAHLGPFPAILLGDVSLQNAFQSRSEWHRGNDDEEEPLDASEPVRSLAKRPIAEISAAEILDLLKKAETDARSFIFSVDVNGVERIGELVGDVQPPFPSRLQFTIDLTNEIPTDPGSSGPCGALVWELGAHQVRRRGIVLNIEKIQGHSVQQWIILIVPSRSLILWAIICQQLSRHERATRHW
jgi:hypothetical protein